MKTSLSTLPILFLAIGYSNNGNSQANQALSNLVNPTAINRHLVPNVTNSRDLGNISLNWRTIYLGSRLFLNGSLSLHAPGTSNLFIGPNAGNPAVLGAANVSVGHYALDNITSGNSNTALGFRALNFLSMGHDNTAVGFRSLYNVTAASANTGVGYMSLHFNTTGFSNTATGHSSLVSNTTGFSNTATGDGSLYFNKTGSYNTANGHNALFNNTTGGFSTAYGAYALYSNTTGNENTAVGSNALLSNLTGGANTAVGINALYSNRSGIRNTANGLSALYYNTTGNHNTANGSFALNANSTGNHNTAIGAGALRSSNADDNTATGYWAMWYNRTGSGNTAVGREAMYYNETGSYNTAIGFRAGLAYAGANNTFIGADAGSNADGYNNSSALGQGSYFTASNQVWLGNLNVTAVWTAGTYFSSSDARFKKNVQENVPGLEFIRKLKPVTYNFDMHGLNEKTKAVAKATDKNSAAAKAGVIDEKAMQEKEKKVYSGFLAQDVEQAAKALNYDFSGVYKPQNDKDIYGLSYSEFVVPLVKAVQELSVENDNLREQNARLEARLQKIETLLKISAPAAVSDASLNQNTPNPFKGSTVISYNLPQRFNAAQVVLYNAAGKILKQVNVSGNGKGTLRLDAASLAAGAYSYSLVVDGKVVDTKKMLLSK